MKKLKNSYQNLLPRNSKYTPHGIIKLKIENLLNFVANTSNLTVLQIAYIVECSMQEALNVLQELKINLELT